MPELPEVETTVRGIRAALENRVIRDVWMDWPSGLATPSPEVFKARVVGQQVRTVARRAKYILIHLEADTLLVHLKMTGRLYVVPDSAIDHADKWVHFRFQLDNAQQLRFSDSRKFGRVYLVEDVETITGRLGPEPLEDAYTLDVFLADLEKHKGAIKPLLLNQHFVAGVGNIYADEALHLAKIHPARRVDALNDAEKAALWVGIRQALAAGLAREGASINWYRKPDGNKGKAQDSLLVYGRTGQLCLSCGEGFIQKIVIGQRGTHFCPNCQRE